MKLYYLPGACSLASHIALREAEIPVTLLKVDLATKQTEDGKDYLQINSKGYIPALETDSGEVITEGVVICQYIADQKPESGLAPKTGTMERIRLQEWLVFISTELHRNFGGLFYSKTDGEWKSASIDKLTKRFSWVNEQLKGKNYLLGEHFSVADGYLFTVLGWCQRVEFDLSSFPELLAFKARVAERPAVQAALKAEGLI